jgi:phage terminase large subunit-like protein
MNGTKTLGSLNSTWTIKTIERYCLQTEGDSAGKPVQLMPWQKNLLRKSQGKRDVWLEIPRKNGKSATIAMLAIAHLLDGWKRDTNPEVIIAASTKEQAGILFRYVVNMIKRSPSLQVALRPMQYEVRLQGKPGYMKTIAADGGSNHGLNPSLILCDEIHAWSETKGPELWEALETSRGFRNAQMISITTAGAAYTWAWSRHEYARRVIAGEINDPNMCAIIYSAPETADPMKESTWRKANPSYNYLPIKRNLQAEKIKAAHDELKRISFRKLYLNQWIGNQEGYIDFVKWKERTGPRPPDLKHWDCVLGCDFAAVNDFNAYCLIWYRGTRFYTEQYYQISSDAMIKRGNQYPALARQWQSTGNLQVVHGDVVTTDDYLQKISELINLYNPIKIFFDPWNASEVNKKIVEQYGETFAVAVRQSFAFTNEPMKRLRNLVHEGNVTHDGNPITAWMMGNVVVATDKNDNWCFDKKRSPEKIDGVAAMITALSGYINSDLESYYAKYDLVVV